MTATLPETAKRWLDNDEFATLVTIEPDGQPHGSVVWIKRDGEELLVSTMRDRRKHRNILRDPRVTVVVFPLADPYSYVEIRGSCTIEDKGAVELIQALCWGYMGYGIDTDPTERIVLRILPQMVRFHPSRPLKARLASETPRSEPSPDPESRHGERPV